MNGGELLQTSHPPEPLHRAFSSSEREVGVLNSVVEPPTQLAMVAIEAQFNNTLPEAAMSRECSRAAQHDYTEIAERFNEPGHFKALIHTAAIGAKPSSVD